MIKVENIDVCGFKHAIRGMRNPKNSWDKSDTTVAFHAVENFAPGDSMAEKYWEWNDKYGLNIKIGKNDLDLMKRLYKAGTEHRTYARMIQVSMDLTAPLYWWKEMDRYTVGKSQVSCSTMHKIAAKEFELDDFSHEHLGYSNALNVEDSVLRQFEMTIFALNKAREEYLKTKDKKYWWCMIQTLPSSYNQKRTICMSYETVFKIIRERTGHKLDEWNDFVKILKDLPYVKEIIS